MKKIKPTDFKEPYQVYFGYHRKYLINFLMNLWKWEGMPDSVEMRFFNDKLIKDGFAPFWKHEGALICTDGACSGLDIYYRPTTFTSANHILKGVKRQISYIDALKPEGAVVAYNTLNYTISESMMDLVDIYAHKLANIDISIDSSIYNSRVCIIPIVNDEKEAIRTERVLAQMYEGKPSALSYKSGFNEKGIELFPVSARDNIVTSELADAKKNVLTEFLTRLGVDCIAVDKKERTNLVEMNSNNQELKVNANIYLKARELFCDELNKTFGLDVKVSIDKEEVDALLMQEGVKSDEESKELY